MNCGWTERDIYDLPVRKLRALREKIEEQVEGMKSSIPRFR